MISPGMILNERYEVVDKVGSGGMADVYNARDLRLNRNVAIKVLKQEYSNDAKFVAKFRGEAQSVAGLSHPNIVNVYDVEDDENLHYIVMELVEGITLKKFIERKGRLEINEAIGIGIQIAQGMEEAHKNGIIHRDIKPQNIIISKEGKVKVTDFGIAKAATSNTITSNAMGSVHYISPEQARGGYSDEKSDIYSLGVTIYEMLSGRVPFEGDSTVSVAFAHVHEDAPKLIEIDDTIPRSLSRIVQKCMQKKPDMRYENADALIMDLRRAVSEPDGDYVVLDEMVNDSPTIMLSDDMVRAVKEMPRKVPAEEHREEPEEIPDEDAMDPKLERILKICSGVVAVIIVVVLILLLIKVMSPGSSKDKKSEVTTSAQPSPSADVKTVEVPDLMDHTLEEAQQLLEDSGLKYRLESQESDKEPNTVVGQDPAAGEKVEEDTRVTIYYSKEKSGVEVPDVSNMTVAEATSRLEGLGLVVSESNSSEYSNTIPEGKVCGTDPVTGSSVKPGTPVRLVVSKGSKDDMTVVPNLKNKSEQVALEKLADANLQAGKISYVNSDTVQKDRVITQAVKAGKQVKKQRKIDFTVSLGPRDAATEAPTATPHYSYEGSVTISLNPFEYEGEEGTIKLVLNQDGKTKTVFKGKLSYSDFPRKFEVTGWSENNGTVTMCKGADDEVVGSWNIEFKKVAQ